MELLPTDLRIEQGNLVINWSDSKEQSIEIKELRNRCPCANCRDQRSEETESAGSLLPVLGQVQELKIEKMEPAGNYAYTIHFSDGHNKGIFTFEFLRSFAE